MVPSRADSALPVMLLDHCLASSPWPAIPSEAAPGERRGREATGALARDQAGQGIGFPS